MEPKSLMNATLCSLQLAKNHYENFPVIGFFIPKKLKLHVANIYAFARIADDIADEGNISKKVRLSLLEQLGKEIEKPIQPLMQNLYITIKEYNIPKQYFYDLIAAFKQDLIKKRYYSNSELIAYCKLSANPIGRILLSLFNQENLQTIKGSDSLCTALQLINFLQDIKEDLVLKDRIYLPKELLEKYNLAEEELLATEKKGLLAKIINEEIILIKKLLEDVNLLINHTRGSLHWQARIVLSCAKKALNLLKKSDGDVTTKNRIKFYHWPEIILKIYSSV